MRTAELRIFAQRDQVGVARDLQVAVVREVRLQPDLQLLGRLLPAPRLPAEPAAGGQHRHERAGQQHAAPAAPGSVRRHGRRRPRARPALQVGDQRAPARVVAVAVPADQVERVDRAEAQRRLHVLDAQRQQLAGVACARGLVAHEAGVHRRVRPQHQHDARGRQLRSDHVGEVVAAGELPVPPHRQAGLGQRRRQRLGRAVVLARVADEDLRRGAGVQRVGHAGCARRGRRVGSSRVGPLRRSQTVNGRCFRKAATAPIVYRFGVCTAGMPALIVAWKFA